MAGKSPIGVAAPPRLQATRRGPSVHRTNRRVTPTSLSSPSNTGRTSSSAVRLLTRALTTYMPAMVIRPTFTGDPAARSITATAST
jgi:hypothetical protein